MFGKKPKNKKTDWFETAYKLNRKGKLKAPYNALFEYYRSVSWSCKRKYIYGHYDYFMLAKSGGYLDESIKSLQTVLPENLLENFNAAYNAYIALGEDPEYETMEQTMEKFDDYADEHSEEMETILSSYVTEMTERHYL